MQAADGMLGDALEHIGQPGLRVDVVELGRPDQGVDGGSALAAAIRATEQPCLPAEGDTAQGSFGRVVREADPAVLEEPREGRLASV